MRTDPPAFSPTDDALNRLLGRWADRRRPSDVQYRSLRNRIVSEPASLSPEWWRRFAGHLVPPSKTLPQPASTIDPIVQSMLRRLPESAGFKESLSGV